MADQQDSRPSRAMVQRRIKGLSPADERLSVPERVDGGSQRLGPWLTSEEACEYLRFTGTARLQSLYRFLRNHGVQAFDVRHGLEQCWLTSEEACEYLRFTGTARLQSLYRFLRNHGVPRSYRGPKRLLIARADLEEAVRGRRRRKR